MLIRKSSNIANIHILTLNMAQETPSVGTWIRNHKLAHEIMYRRDDGITEPTGGPGRESEPPHGVMDDSELDILERFVSDPTTDNQKHMLTDLGLLPQAGNEDMGKRAAAQGSLASFIVASFGTERPALTDGEIGALREWFGRGRKG